MNPSDTPLAKYIAAKAEFDNMSTQQVYRVLLKSGWITSDTTIHEVQAAREEARVKRQPLLD